MSSDDEQSLGRETVLELRGVSKTYNGITALQPTDLVVHAGDVIVLIGASGSGKSTLLRCVNMLAIPDSGTVTVSGETLDPKAADPRASRRKAAALARQRIRMGMVFQNFNLFEHLSARDNVALAPRKVLKVDKEQARADAERLLATVGLEEHAHKRPSQMSGGQQQRVAIARALALEPVLMLFDEPTSALDPRLTQEVLHTIRDLSERGMTMVLATHEMRFAEEIASQIIYMDAGRIVEQGKPQQIFHDPIEESTREFVACIL
jgi:ABC-type polar amino acid transport system ATPase subunit